MSATPCLNDGSVGPNVLGCRDDFDFTLTFERAILSILPSAFFIALAAPRIAYLLQRPQIVGGSWFNYVKAGANCTFAALQLALTALSASRTDSRTIFVASSALAFIAALVFCVVSFLEHPRSPRPSALLALFLGLTLLFDVAQTRSLWLSALSSNDFAFAKVFTAGVALKTVVLGLEAQQKSKWIQWDAKEHSPEESVGFWGLGAMVWLSTLFLRGYRKVLGMEDLYPLDSTLHSELLYKKLERSRQGSPKGRKHGLARDLARAFAGPLLLPIAGRLCLAAFQFCQPFLIESVLDYLQMPAGTVPANHGYGLIGAALLIYVGIALSNTFYWYFQERTVWMFRGALASAIYRKSTEARVSAADDSAALTLMSTDVERIRMGFLFLQEFWVAPIEIGVASYLLARHIGAAFAAPLVVVIVCIILEVFVARMSGPRQKKWMAKIQKRVGLTANIISNMKHLKISGLTGPVEDSIQNLRVDELKSGAAFRMVQCYALVVAFIPNLFAPVFTFAVTSKTLDVTTIFTSISYLMLLTNPLMFLFQLVPSLMAGLACLGRIQDFLEKEPREDFREYSVDADINSKPSGAPGIEIKNGSFGWVEDEYNLKDINVKIPAAALTIIVGPIASGKSTLCKALLGETPYNKGSVIFQSRVPKIGYCDQVPFLFNASIRDNITGFAPFDEQRYAEVVEASMLVRDFALLPQGDKSMVGSNGITLSGGQKQRLSIARALYLHTELLIFDDILSGLDADTEEALFQQVFSPVGILKRRGCTTVLCTHSVRHLPNTDHIIALSPDGTLVEAGTFKDLLANQKYVHGLGVQISSSDSESGRSSPTRRPMLEMELTQTKTNATAEIDGVQDLSRQQGDIRVYKHYFQSIGYSWVAMFILSCAISGFLWTFPTVWLKFWAEDITSAAPRYDNAFYIGIYSLLQGLAMVVLFLSVTMSFTIMIRRAGANLHKGALQTVCTAPLRFFTTTDSGVIINYFSQDITLIDGELPMSLSNFSFQVFICIASAGVIASASPFIVVTYPFILAVLYGIQVFYLRTSRQMRLLDLEAKSPLYTNFLDTIRGVATFRSFGWVADGLIKNTGLLNTSQRPAYLLAMIQRWLLFVLNFMVAILAVGVVALATQLRSGSGFTGASLVSLMTMGDNMSHLIQMYTLLETSIGAVARLKSFSEKTHPENQPGETVVPPKAWPQRGRIELDGVSATYDDIYATKDDTSSTDEKPSHALALNNLTLTVEPGQKVAICGRSGSGKSSTILLLLRLLETVPEHEGTMAIDGLPLNTVDRATLRRRVIAVPQDAVFLPDGTSFKDNLDPYAISTDAECQVILEAVELWAFVQQRGGLAAPMSADVLSQGQKQLFSLARAMVRRRVRSRELAAEVGDAYMGTEKDGEKAAANGAQGGVLLLDEVSSSVDVETDRAMQRIIHREFAGYSIVMVSHRLEMVMDFDQVVVMDAGAVVEAGPPRDLVEVDGGRFRELWLIGNQEAA